MKWLTSGIRTGTSVFNTCAWGLVSCETQTLVILWPSHGLMSPYFAWKHPTTCSFRPPCPSAPAVIGLTLGRTIILLLPNPSKPQKPIAYHSQWWLDWSGWNLIANHSCACSIYPLSHLLIIDLFMTLLVTDVFNFGHPVTLPLVDVSIVCMETHYYMFLQTTMFICSNCHWIDLGQDHHFVITKLYESSECYYPSYSVMAGLIRMKLNSWSLLCLFNVPSKSLAHNGPSYDLVGDRCLQHM